MAVTHFVWHALQATRIRQIFSNHFIVEHVKFMSMALWKYPHRIANEINENLTIAVVPLLTWFDNPSMDKFSYPLWNGDEIT